MSIQDSTISNGIAFAGLLVMGGISALSFAFMLGQIHNRVQNHGARLKALEDSGATRDREHTALSNAVAGLSATVSSELKHVTDAIAEFRDLLRQGRRRSSTPD